MTSDDLVTRLLAAFGADTIETDPELVASSITSWRGQRWVGTAAIASPRSTEECAEIVRWCRRHKVPVIPQGGNTGLVGGSVPREEGCLVLSTRRLKEIESVDLVEGTVSAQAGVTLGALAAALEGSGWRYAVDFGARDAATVGGSIATNAGGMRVFRFGTTREQLASLEYVTPAGEVVGRLCGLRKDNAGYDLTSLLCGSEGTLGVMTSATLRLIPEVSNSQVALLEFASVQEALDASWELRRRLPHAEAIELMSGKCLRLSDPSRSDASWHVLVEVSGDESAASELESELEAALGSIDSVVDIDVAGSASQRAGLWNLREEITPALAALDVGKSTRSVKADVSIPGASMGSYIANCERSLERLEPAASLWVFGHVCDHNLHMNVTGCNDAATTLGVLLDEAIAVGGSPSAEHGIGTEKVRWLASYRSATDVATMLGIKAMLDPSGLFNPGVIFDETNSRAGS